MHEELLKHYFEQESTKGDLSAEQWEDVLLRVRRQKERGWFGRVMAPLTARQPALSIAASLVIAIMVGAISLWIIAPWEGHAPYPSRAIPGAPGDPGRPGDSGVVGRLGEPGSPAPIYFERVWRIDKSLVLPGEPIAMTLALKNIWDKPIEFTDFPETVTLRRNDIGGEAPIQLRLERREGVTDTLEPGEELTAVVNITSVMSAGFQPGRYGVWTDGISFDRDRDNAEEGQTTWGFGGPSFVVTPAEGALDTTVVVGEAREIDGTRLTLERVHFSPERTIVVVLAQSLSEGFDESRPAGVPRPAATIQPRGTPTPASAVAESPWDGDITELTAFYRLDGGTWRLLRNHAYREMPDGVRHEWSIDPVSVNANTLEFAIVPGVRPGRDGTFTYPTDDTASSWEWTVPLQGIEKR